MALLYGEGERAFIRLQEEVMKTSDDDSLFAWAAKDSDPKKSRGLLASSPGEFQEAGSISSCHDWTKSSLPYAMTNKGLRISLSLNITAEQNVYLALLNCLATNYNNGTLAIYLKRLSSVGDQYVRVHPNKVATFNGNRSTSTETIYVRQRTPLRNLESFGQEQQFLIQTDVSVPALGYVLSLIDTPTGLMPLDGDILAKGLPIPKGSNGWIAALGYRHKSPENKNRFWVLLGFTPDSGVSIRITHAINHKDFRGPYAWCDPTEPSVLEGFLIHESGSAFGKPYNVRKRLYIEAELQRRSGKNTYVVRVVMEH